MSTEPVPDVRRRCRVCLQSVPVYRPTRTNIERAAEHNRRGQLTAEVWLCAGSFGPVDPLTHGAREDAATRRWAESHQGDLAEPEASSR